MTKNQGKKKATVKRDKRPIIAQSEGSREHARLLWLESLGGAGVPDELLAWAAFMAKNMGEAAAKRCLGDFWREMWARARGEGMLDVFSELLGVLENAV